jgi:hypothetical protein
VLWHLGHRGSSRDSITYIMHRGHPARIIGKPPTTPSSGLPSDDTHELGGDAVEDDDDESLLGDPPPLTTGFADDAPPRDRDDRLRRSSCSLDTLPRSSSLSLFSQLSDQSCFQDCTHSTRIS